MAPKVAKKVVSSDCESSETTKQRSCNAVSLKLAKEVKEFMGDNASDLSQDMISKVCNAFIKVIIDQVKSGKNVTLTNHMTFKRNLSDERMRKNPKTQESILKPAHYTLKMELKPALKVEFAQLDVAEQDVAEQDEPEKPVKRAKAAEVAEVVEKSKKSEDSEESEEDEPVKKPKGKGKKVVSSDDEDEEAKPAKPAKKKAGKK